MEISCTKSSRKTLRTPFVIGEENSGAGIERHIKATIDEVRIYNRALSEKEIEILYNSAKPTFAL